MHLNVFIITLAAWISFSSARLLNDGSNQDVLSETIGVNDETDNVMDDIMLKHEKAKEFFQRDRRGLYHECYDECCSKEEVIEHYNHDLPAANEYWNEFTHWLKTHTCGKSFW